MVISLQPCARFGSSHSGPALDHYWNYGSQCHCTMSARGRHSGPHADCIETYILFTNIMHYLSWLSDFSCLDIKFCIVLNARGVHELSKSLEMRLIYSRTFAWSFGILFLLWVASVWTFHSASCCARSDNLKPDNCLALTNHSMPKRASVTGTRPASAPQALGYKCITCNAEFDTRHGAACHRRHPSSNGTACADPNSVWSVSITPRPDVSAGMRP